MIQNELLEQYGAVEKCFEKSDVIFEVNTNAHYYFQIISGEVKMNNYNEEGKEFIQGFFKPGESFGEPPLFVERTYPANAIATEDSILLAIKKKSIFKITFRTSKSRHLDNRKACPTLALQSSDGCRNCL